MVDGVYFHCGVLSYIYDEAILGRIVKQFLLLGSFFLFKFRNELMQGDFLGFWKQPLLVVILDTKVDIGNGGRFLGFTFEVVDIQIFAVIKRSQHNGILIEISQLRAVLDAIENDFDPLEVQDQRQGYPAVLFMHMLS